MNNTIFKKLAIMMTSLCLATATMAATRQMEYLDRGVVAVKTSNGVFVSWRALGTEPLTLGFNIYRDGVLLNSTPLTTKTNYEDAKGTTSSSYVVKSVQNGKILTTSAAVKPWANSFLSLQLKRPTSSSCTYSPNDMSAGDVDGDGQYELIVKWDPSNSKDNSQSGTTGNVYLDCYKLDGTFKWRIDLGMNIRAGAHYTQFQVFDYDGDGKAEVVCRTAPGTVDGAGKNVLMGSDQVKDYRNSKGYILSGPEYLTVFNGNTGAQITSVAYNPARGNVGAWGDTYGNRVDRFLACTAYLDGVHPSMVFCRGYYTQSNLVAYDFKNGKLTQRWEYHGTDKTGTAYGQGFHNLSVADVDGDGYDEIVYGSACIDHDGKLKYTTGFGHGDAMHISDMDPSTTDLEGWFVHEEKTSPYGYELRNLRTGKVIFGKKTGSDNGRGCAADIDPAHKGFEMWSTDSYNVFDCKGNIISTKRPGVNFRIYWDGDLQDEILDGTTISKWSSTGMTTLLSCANYGSSASCNTTKATPCLSADLFGDWREEVIFWNSSDPSKINIFTTTTPTEYRLFTLMHDPVYREAIAWQNTAYNQPPHLGFYIGDGLSNVKLPDITLVNAPSVTPIDERKATTYIYSQTKADKLSWSDVDNWTPKLSPLANDTTIIRSGEVQADGLAQTAPMTVEANGVLRLMSDCSVNSLALQGGTLKVYTSSPLFALSGNVQVNKASTLLSGSAATSVFSLKAVISGNADLSKTGIGIADLKTNNGNFKGLWVVSEGTLRVSAAGALGATGAEVASGATLDVAADAATKSISLSTGAKLHLAAGLTVESATLGSVSLPNGKYTAADYPAFISGTDTLYVARPFPAIRKTGAGSSRQTVAAGVAIVDFGYSWTNADNVTVTWSPSAPKGITVTVDKTAKTVIISGTPAADGVYDFTVTTSAFNDSVAVKSGVLTVGGSTDVAQVEAQTDGLQLMPNPTSGQVELSVSAPAAGTAILSVASISGAVVYQRVVTVKAGLNNIPADFTSFATGVYSLKVVTRERTWVEKLIKR